MKKELCTNQIHFDLMKIRAIPMLCELNSLKPKALVETNRMLRGTQLNPRVLLQLMDFIKPELKKLSTNTLPVPLSGNHPPVHPIHTVVNHHAASTDGDSFIFHYIVETCQSFSTQKRLILRKFRLIEVLALIAFE